MAWQLTHEYYVKTWKFNITCADMGNIILFHDHERCDLYSDKDLSIDTLILFSRHFIISYSYPRVISSDTGEYNLSFFFLFFVTESR